MADMRRTLLTLAGLALGRIYLQFIAWDPYPRTGLVEMVAGTANRPFVTRVLAPRAIHLVSAFMGWPLETSATVLVYVSLIAWLLALAWLADALLPPAAARAAPLVAAGPVCLLFVSGGYTYDLPTLALLTLALGLLARGKWGSYLALFPIIALCRETAILLVPVYWLWRRRRRSPNIHTGILPNFHQGLTLQLVAFLLIRGGLAWLYRGNGGSTFEIHWAEHLAYLITYPVPNILALAIYSGALILALYRWRAQPVFLQDAAIIIPAIFFAYWLVGFPGEIRVMLEAYPVLFLLAYWSVWARFVEPTVSRIRSLCAAWAGRRRLITR